ncbi:1-phosphofructokinase family hexose kinase [Pedobacter sp. Du54]|uniref:1-phosphofructokinase family hexose kinase n=1 Tax=Pedobacter anseongensis TaxID=3133439 RepID=UPI00309CAC8D
MKPVIITLTLSPAIDKSTTIEKLIADKKLNCSCPVYEPGGGGINVARAIHRLGGNALAVYPAGGYPGKTFHNLLTRENVHQLVIQTIENTRENLVVLETSTHKQYRFGMPAPLLAPQEVDNCLTAVSNIKQMAFLVVSGRFPSGTQRTLFAGLVKIAKAKNAKLIVDSSGEGLKQAVDVGAYLIKPNVRELSALSGKVLRNKHSVIIAAKNIISNSECEIIVVSMAEKGALLVTSEMALQAIPPKVMVKSTVGAGDSTVAGLVWSLAHGKSLKDALKFAVACGTAATMNAGTELCHAGDVNELLNRVKLSAM